MWNFSNENHTPTRHIKYKRIDFAPCNKPIMANKYFNCMSFFMIQPFIMIQPLQPFPWFFLQVGVVFSACCNEKI